MGPILVAGARGFIGTAVVTRLAREGRRVRALGRSRERLARAFGRLPIEAMEADVTRAETLDAAVAGCSAIVGCVQFDNSPFENPRRGLTFDAVDNWGTRNLVAAARRAGIERYVYVSGAGANARAREPWFRAKGEAEDALRASGLACTIVRPSWVYGPGDRALNRFAGIARHLPFVPVPGDGRQRLQPVFIEDLAQAVADCIPRADCAGKTFEIGGPGSFTMNEILEVLMRVLGKRRALVHLPPWILKLAARFAEWLPTPPLTRGGVDFLLMEAVVDTRLFSEAFPDLRLTFLERGLAAYLRA